MAREHGESIVNRWVIAGLAALGLMVTIQVTLYGHVVKLVDNNRVESDARWAESHKEIIALAEKIQIHDAKDSHVGTSRALQAINQRLDDANTRNNEDHKEIKSLLNRMLIGDRGKPSG